MCARTTALYHSGFRGLAQHEFHREKRTMVKADINPIKMVESAFLFLKLSK